MPNNNPNQPRTTSANKMLIDATHPEETRVVVLRSGRVEEFDYESAARKLLRGNIYLAKVTRVEPSLQAAFVDYGGNRHGFLAFNEIHPDYYQIPIADRRALIEAEAAAEAEEEAAVDRAAEAAAARRARRRGPSEPTIEDAEDNAVEVVSLLPAEPIEIGGDAAERDSTDHDDRYTEGPDHDTRDAEAPDRERESDQRRTYAERSEPDAQIVESAPREPETAAEHVPTESTDYERRVSDEPPAYDREPSSDESPQVDVDAVHGGSAGEGRIESIENGNGAEADQIETVATDEDVMEEVPVRPRRRLRSYKIQEVTKRRQVLLVQVVKEERGTKGAALTTYLSLAGRYTVLMPNTARGGGISRKITNPQDRKRLKAIAAELDVPEGMGLIIRTAGAARTKQEIKRDYEYLLRLWESVRELALGSNAPALVYEEGNLIKRSIRDLYGKEVEEIVVAGEAAYREAKDFMRMLMPSHAKNVLHYQDAEQLFARYQIERQLNAMFSPYVHLRSGGYLVINQTEALVAIDINSGKSTREFSIEETAYSTNMEAADEIARQLKLRDLAGLIVIDFIDMEEKRNNRAVERRLKEALRHDRARIQLGHISHFGLLEMSRQRMRTGVLEGSTTQCPHCQGTGIIRSTESVALAVLRGLEDALMTGQPASLTATTTAAVALYILNNKRTFINEMETRYGITIQIQASERMQGANFTVERLARREEPQRRPERTAVNMDWGFEDEDSDQEAVVESEQEGEEETTPSGEARHSRSVEGGDGRRRRRRRRRGRRDDQNGHAATVNGQRGERSAEDDVPHSSGQRTHDITDDDDQAQAPDHDHVHAVIEDVGDDLDEADADRDTRDGEQEEPGALHSEGEAGERRGRRRRRGRRGGRRGPGGERPAASAAEGEDAFNGVSREAGSDGESRLPAAVEATGGEVSDHERLDAEPTSTAQIHVPAWRPRAIEPMVEPSHVAPHPTPAVALEQGVPTSAHVADEVAAHAAQAPAPAPTAVAEAEKAPSSKTEEEPAKQVAASESALSPRTTPVASEPVLERVVVGPDAAVVQQAEESARPVRRGWWQRR